MSAPLDHVEVVKEYALITRGEHPRWEGDRILNGESFAFRIGRESADATELVRSLGIAEAEYSLITGLPPGSLRRMSAMIKRGIADASRPVSAPDLAAVRAALAQYMPTGMPWTLAGPANVAARQRLMLALTGRKVPRAQCGITAIWAAIESAGVPLPGSCPAVRERNLATWIRTGVAV